MKHRYVIETIDQSMGENKLIDQTSPFVSEYADARGYLTKVANDLARLIPSVVRGTICIEPLRNFRDGFAITVNSPDEDYVWVQEISLVRVGDVR